MTEVEDIVFEPEYGWKAGLGFALFPIAAVVLAVIVLPDPLADIELTMAAVISAAFSLLIPRALVKEIRFGQVITVHRFLLPPKSIAYSDVVDVGGTGLKARGGGFGWIGYRNGKQLAQIVEALVEKGVIREEQLEGEAVLGEVSSLYAAMITAVLSPVVALLVW